MTTAGPYPAPAKVNRFLHVVGRRPDGYHLIESAMQLVDLADTIEIEPRADGRIVREGRTADVVEDDDLAIRAARMLQKAGDVGAGATIAVGKRIPIGGGLGGGSSDAATVLLALNRLWQLDWPRAALADVGIALGADVPFFIGGTSAFVEGIGDRLTPIALPARWFAIVFPGVGVATRPIFEAPELTRNTAPLKIAGFARGGSRDGSEAPDLDDAERFRNDLEPVAAARFDAVREALAWLGSYEARGVDAGGTARMSGSGACVIRAFADEGEAQRCAADVPAPWTGWCAGSIERHPLFDHARD